MGERQVYFLRMLVAKDLIFNFSLRKYNSWSLVIFISRLSWFPLLKSNIVVIGTSLPTYVVNLKPCFELSNTSVNKTLTVNLKTEHMFKVKLMKEGFNPPRHLILGVERTTCYFGTGFAEFVLVNIALLQQALRDSLCTVIKILTLVCKPWW